MLEFLKKKNIKFDLHTHTTYTDGDSTVKEIIKLANEKDIKYLSISDHDEIGAYLELENNDNYGFKGEIIKGCEITTEMEGYNVEFLAYGFDIERFKNFKPVQSEYRYKKMYDHTLKNIEKMKEYGFVFRNFQFPKNKEKFNTDIYNHLIAQPENTRLFQQLEVHNFKQFLREQLKDPNGKLYVSPKGFLPTAKEVCDFVHSCGGVVVLAHAFYYGKVDGKKIIDIALNYDIDGIECIHFSHSLEQMKYIKKIAKKHGLITTGGSDYHGRDRHLDEKSVKSVLGYANVIKRKINTNIFDEL